MPKDSSDKALKGFATCLCKCLYTPMWDRNGGMNMAKTTWKVISYYEGTQTVQEILVDLIAEKGSFEPFYEETVLLQETDPNVIYDMKNTLLFLRLSRILRTRLCTGSVRNGNMSGADPGENWV